jgi:hypothetical protein
MDGTYLGGDRFLAADLIDHMHITIVPIVLARGERLWDGFQQLEEASTLRRSVRPAASPISRSRADRSHGTGLQPAFWAQVRAVRELGYGTVRRGVSGEGILTYRAK